VVPFPALGAAVTCGADISASACTTDDVVRGLGVVSSQVHGLSGFLLYATLIVVLLLVALAIVGLSALRRAR
jgi:hypothetical protein